MRRHQTGQPAPHLPGTLRDQLAPVPLTRAPVRGWLRWAFWGLRVYIAVMLVLVVIGFIHGVH
jgi:hypothetical protein